MHSDLHTFALIFTTMIVALPFIAYWATKPRNRK